MRLGGWGVVLHGCNFDLLLEYWVMFLSGGPHPPAPRTSSKVQVASVKRERVKRWAFCRNGEGLTVSRKTNLQALL